MGRPNRYSTADVIAALRATKGMIYLAARHLGCSAETVLSYCRRYPAVAQAKRDARGVLLDVCELKLWQAIERNEHWAIAFCLKTLGKDRGYVERTEHAGADGQPVVLKVVYDQSPVIDLPQPQPPAARNGRA